MLRVFATLCLVVLTMTASPAQTGRGPRESTIGLPAVLDDVRLAGSELEARKMDDLAPATVRIIEAWPDGENQWRYKLEWRAFTPGEHDLLQLLRRKDGSSTSELAPLVVTGTAVLTESGVVKPTAPQATQLGSTGGYRLMLWVLGGAWLVGLALIVRAMRSQRSQAQAARSISLAERLRPLVERAARGELDQRATAQLETALVALWRKRLQLETQDPTTCILQLKAHAEAGPLLRGLEQWLHAPAGRTQVDVSALLAPYAQLSAEEFGAPLEAESKR